MPGSTGSGDLTAGEEGPSFCCSTEDGPSKRFKSEHRKVVKTWERFLPFCCTGEESGGFAGVFDFCPSPRMFGRSAKVLDRKWRSFKQSFCNLTPR